MCLPQMTIPVESYDLHSCRGHILSSSPIPTRGNSMYRIIIHAQITAYRVLIIKYKNLVKLFALLNTAIKCYCKINSVFKMQDLHPIRQVTE